MPRRSGLKLPQPRKSWKPFAWKCWAARARLPLSARIWGGCRPRNAGGRESAECRKAGSRIALDEAKAVFDAAELALRLDAEWVDLTLPLRGSPRQRSSRSVSFSTKLSRYSLPWDSSSWTARKSRPSGTTSTRSTFRRIIPRVTCRIRSGWKVEHVLRTHTSPVQIRGMQKLGPPLRMIAPGRVFRNEEVDPSHEHTFYQLEGMMIDREVSIAHMLYFMKTLLSAVFKRDVTVRLRPGYFPFVEPGFELDIQCLICGGSGCPVCKQTGWVELLPCGLVHPNVLRFGGIDPEKWNGFAFGLGLTRLVMMRYAIDDIRLLQSGDLRFNRQF